MFRVPIFLLFFVAISGCEKESAELLSYGIVENPTVETKADRNSPTGTFGVVETWTVVNQTTTIPNRIGVDFGIEYKTSGPFYAQTVTIEEVIIFPDGGITNPDTGKTTKYYPELTRTVPGENYFFSYQFDYPWEAKSGEWVFQVKYDGIVMVEKKFNVVQQAF